MLKFMVVGMGFLRIVEETAMRYFLNCITDVCLANICLTLHSRHMNFSPWFLNSYYVYFFHVIIASSVTQSNMCTHVNIDMQTRTHAYMHAHKINRKITINNFSLSN